MSIAMEELRYFFSYSSKDTEFVVNLTNKLRDAGVSLWIDRKDIDGGQHWDLSVEKALKNCQGMIVALSPDSLASTHVMDEVSFALERKKLVVPVLVRPCEMPLRLHRVQRIDFTADYDSAFQRLLGVLRCGQGVSSTASAGASASRPDGDAPTIGSTPLATSGKVPDSGNKAIDDGRPFHNKILSCGIVEYARQDSLQQHRYQQHLTQTIQSVFTELGLVLERDVIALPTWDGIALNFLAQEPDVHLRAAIGLLRTLQARAAGIDKRFGMRIGLNTHVDMIVADIHGKPNIVGPGITFAQRVMELGQHGQVLMHDRVRMDLQAFPGYVDKIVFRGIYTAKNGGPIPVAQFIDSGATYINSELLPGPVPQRETTLDLDGILRTRVRENLVSVSLDARARDYLDEIREFIRDFLDEHGEFQRLKIAVMWVASEMLDNAFRHGNSRPTMDATLSLYRTRSGIVVKVDQPDVSDFQVENVLRDVTRDVSFMDLMHRRGLHWRQERRDGRLALSLEIPRDLDMQPLPVHSVEAGDRNKVELPDAVVAFLDRLTDDCTHGNISLVRIRESRLDQATPPGRVTTLLAKHLSPQAIVILDLGSVTYISSGGLRELMIAARQAKEVGARVVIAQLTPMVQQIFQISRFFLIFGIYQDSETAFRALSDISR
jgi:anti-anti-sigma factor